MRFPRLCLGPRLGRVRIGFAVLLACALGAIDATPVRAQSLLKARVGTTETTGASGIVSQTLPTVFGSHSSAASYGYLVATSSIATGDVGTDNGLAAVASFQDDITITDPAAVGVVGTMTALVRVVGQPDYTAVAMGPSVSQGVNASYQVLTIRNGGTGNFLDGAVLFNRASVPEESVIGTMPAPGLVEVEFVFSFGFSLNFGMSLNAQSSGFNAYNPPDSGNIAGMSEMILIWEGITSIEDSMGNELIGSATIVSGSGVDWREAQALPPPSVPLGPIVAPSAGVMMILLGARATRRRAGG